MLVSAVSLFPLLVLVLLVLESLVISHYVTRVILVGQENIIEETSLEKDFFKKAVFLTNANLAKSEKS